MIIFLLLYCLSICGIMNGFNLDTEKPVIFKGEENGSMFGYSVELHKDTTGSWVLIGAPRSKRHSKYISGDVFKCSTEENRGCHVLNFHEEDDGFQFHSNRSDQWFGASLASDKSSGNILACAPLMWFRSPDSDGQDNTRCSPNRCIWKHGNMVGGCYVLQQENNNVYTRYDPCVNASYKLDPNRGQYMCQAGMSAIFDKDGQHIVMGATGSYDFQGQLIVQKVGEHKPVRKSWKMASRNSEHLGYAGISLGLGNLKGGNSYEYITGAPRYKLVGKVKLYNDKLRVLTSQFNGEQLGEYYGNSIAVADFDGNGLDDLAVGAPLYSNDKRGSYEVGRVFIYYQQRSKRKFNKYILDGPQTPGSRFGTSLASAVDLNRDGFQDLIIGAPYAGEYHTGAIYLYYGSDNGLKIEYSQVIHGHTFNPDISAFGYSVATGLDLDGNGYPDVVVGAYDSDNALFFRSRPVVIPTVHIDANNTINLREKQGKLPSGISVTGFKLKTCIGFKGYNISSSVAFNVTWTLDARKKRQKRAFFMDIKNHPATHSVIGLAHKNDEFCSGYDVFIREDIQDKLSPIIIEVKFNIVERLFPMNELKPVLDMFTPNHDTKEIQTLKYCGHDEVCIPDLYVQVHSSTDVLTLGQPSNINLQIEVGNNGEDSYESKLFIMFPKGIQYINVNFTMQNTDITCASRTNVNDSLAVCDVGNPLPRSEKVEFTIKLHATDFPFEEDVINIHFFVNSSNPENTTDTFDNQISLELNLTSRTDIHVMGISNPEEILYKRKPTSELSTGLHKNVLSHMYEVRNLGPTYTMKTRVEISWPSHEVDGSALIHLAETPQVLNSDRSCCNGQCYLEHSNDVEQYESLGGRLTPIISAELEDDNVIPLKDINYQNKYKIINCSENTEDCIKIICDIYQLKKDESSLIEITGNIDMQKLQNLAEIYKEYGILLLPSTATAYVTDMPLLERCHGCVKSTFSIRTILQATSDPSEYLWIMICIPSSLIGVLILYYSVAVLYMLGFFKRKKVPVQNKAEYQRSNSTPVDACIVKPYNDTDTTM